MTHACARHPEPHWHCYTACRCRCRGCTTAINVYKQQLKSRHTREVVSVDRQVVADHVRDLQRRYGITLRGIARSAGYGNDSTVRNALDPSITRPVPARAAMRLLAVGWETIADDALVDGRLASDLLDGLLEAGVARHTVARRLGWSGWPGDHAWPSRRVRMGAVRTLQALLDEQTAPRCESCDRPPLAGGRWCLPCFQDNADQRPSPSWHPSCGTRTGYHRHHRAGERPCDDCKAARRRRKAAA